MILSDSTIALASQGYGWLPNRRRRTRHEAVHARLLGRRVVGLCGPEAARFFYDENHIRRQGAIKGPILSTLFGHGAVHTLDGAAHRQRKAMFLSLVNAGSIDALVEHVGAVWDDAAGIWRRVVLFDEAARVLTRGACGWAGITLKDAEVPAVAADLIAMVDRFATPGPRHWRARVARLRCEAWLAGLVEDVRAGRAVAPPGSALQAVSAHQEGGVPLTPRVAAVELLNVIRPTVAVAYFVTFAGHALHCWPDHRARLGEAEFAEAFGHELRRFYPFAPFLAGRAVRDLVWHGERIPADTLVLLDLYGQNHDSRVWTDPYRFDPSRFLGHSIGAFELVPQGAGDPSTGHRCPGEPFTVALLNALVPRLARLDYEVPDQDLSISLRRIPARPRSGVVLTVHAAAPDRH